MKTIHPHHIRGVRVHELKSWSMFYQDIILGDRTSDIRSEEDRDFRVGDYLRLLEWDPVKGAYTGRRALVQVTYLQRNKSNPCAISREALAEGYCVLSIRFTGAQQ